MTNTDSNDKSRLTDAELERMEKQYKGLTIPRDERELELLHDRDLLLAEVLRLREEVDKWQRLYTDARVKEEETHFERDAPRGRLNLYEAPEGERDLTPVCSLCGSERPIAFGNVRWACPEHGLKARTVEMWQYRASQRILNGEGK
jgi:hypothetical protein